jgi:Protein of unknown function (DUF3074)
MAALHSALQSLGPCKFDKFPRSPSELEPFLQDLFQQSQLILDSIPIPPPEDKLQSRPRSHTTTSVASTASEISSSSARSAPPIPEHAALQKEWGKPVKLNAKDNPLNMVVYRMGGKDGRGAWFARRSVQEGLGFAKFKKSLEMEFPESLAVQGAPGEGNVRGIGGDKKVEDILVPGKGRVEVFQLSAQFPGPTAPRDFVTVLITSSNAIKQNDDTGRPDLSPRHYMIISKPCDHPETQPRDGFVRGNYESVEFIREVPRLPTKTRSSLDLRRLADVKGNALEKEALIRNAETKNTNPLSTSHDNKSMNNLTVATKANEEANRRRGKTISFSESRAGDLRTDEDETERYDPESNPVEWIMVTRSDPGGSVPRFMVERGTPGGIVADASKFLDWACQKEHVGDSKSESHIEFGHRRDSFASYEANGHLVGINGDAFKEVVTSKDRPSTAPSPLHSQTNSANQSGILSNMTGAFSAGLEAYAPQIVLDHLAGHSQQESEDTTSLASTTPALKTDNDDDDTSDSLSTTSFASADSHLDNDSDHATNLSPSTSRISSSSQKDDKGKSKSKPQLTPHEKELQKLDARRAALDAKLASMRSKSAKSAESQTAKEKEAIRKAEEKYAKELRKQEEKYRREVEKIEERRLREIKRGEEKKRKEGEKKDGESEVKKVKRERDEAREGVKKLKREIKDVWVKQVGDLQKENTGLAARVGRLEKELEELKDSSNVAVDDQDEDKTGKGEGKEKEKAKEREKPFLAVTDQDAVRNLVKEERAHQGGARMRGVSFGSASPSASSVDSASSASRSSRLLKRATTMGMGGGNGDGNGSPGHGKGASAS